jgi:hypothetical protein
LFSESSDLEETLKRYRTTTSNQADFDFDPLQCTWKDVLRELERAKAAASESEARGKKINQRVWRAIGTKGADIFVPALAAIPDKLCILKGGLAVIFSVSLVVEASFVRQSADFGPYRLLGNRHRIAKRSYVPSETFPMSS